MVTEAITAGVDGQVQYSLAKCAVNREHSFYSFSLVDFDRLTWCLVNRDEKMNSAAWRLSALFQ